MEFAVHRLIVLVDELEGMTAVAVHEAIAVWCAAVRKEEGHLVGGFWSQGDEIPEHIGILHAE